jgi:hypothetical protein
MSKSNTIESVNPDFKHITIHEFGDYIAEAIKIQEATGVNLTVYAEGPSGIGKSEVVKQATEKAGYHMSRSSCPL